MREPVAQKRKTNVIENEYIVRNIANEVLLSGPGPSGENRLYLKVRVGTAISSRSRFFRKAMHDGPEHACLPRKNGRRRHQACRSKAISPNGNFST